MCREWPCTAAHVCRERRAGPVSCKAHLQVGLGLGVSGLLPALITSLAFSVIHGRFTRTMQVSCCPEEARMTTKDKSTVSLPRGMWRSYDRSQQKGLGLTVGKPGSSLSSSSAPRGRAVRSAPAVPTNGPGRAGPEPRGLQEVPSLLSPGHRPLCFYSCNLETLANFCKAHRCDI